MKEFPGTQGLFGEGGINEYNAPFVLECIEREMEEENNWELEPSSISILGYIITLIPLAFMLLYKLVSGIVFLVNARNAPIPKNHKTFRIINPDYARVPDQPGYVRTKSGILIPGEYNVL